MPKLKLSSQEYWEKNIEGFSGFYEKCSQELLQTSPLMTSAYKAIIFPLEKKVMERRFEMVSAFVADNARPGVQAADIGCGGGVYTKQMASLGAHVHASDFTDSALKLTKSILTPEESTNVVLTKMDIMAESIPPVDIAISIGVVPYINRLGLFLDHILPLTGKSFLFNFLDKNSWMNKVRHVITALDVRGYYYYSVDEVRAELERRGFEAATIQKLGTGYMVESKRKHANA